MTNERHDDIPQDEIRDEAPDKPQDKAPDEAPDKAPEAPDKARQDERRPEGSKPDESRPEQAPLEVQPDELRDDVPDEAVVGAFDDYRDDPGGEVRLDTDTITVLGRRRVRRQRLLIGGAGAAAAAVIVAGVVAVPNLAGQGGDRTSVTAAGAGLPSTGRDVTKLFGEARGRQEGPIKQGTGGADVKFVQSLGSQPEYLDTGWQPDTDGRTPRVRWALATWVDGDQAAEALLAVDTQPIYAAIYPPPYQTCAQPMPPDAPSCSVRKIEGQGWLKVIKSAPGTDAKLTVSLQRMSESRGGSLITFTVSGGAATKAALAGDRKPMGRLPVDEKAATDAVLSTQ